LWLAPQGIASHQHTTLTKWVLAGYAVTHASSNVLDNLFFFGIGTILVAIGDGISLIMLELQ
jgi:hypothetical protein